RSDCRFLPEEHLKQITGVKSAIENNCPELQTAVDHADFTSRSKAWNNKKVEAHHAIIPTLRKAKMDNLSVNEKAVYQVVATQYLAQFYPAYKYTELQIDVDIQGGKFISKANQMFDEGWKVLFRNKNNQIEANNDDNESNGLLTKLVKKGETVQCIDTELVSKETQPPRPFTDATLLSAMTGIARFVKDPEIKKILRETDGLGTEATRAGIIELLFKRQFLTRQSKAIRSTEVGKNLILSLPDIMSMPDMTAHWELQLNKISKKEFSYQQFMHQLNLSLLDLVNHLKNARLNIQA
ncbi:MAG: hypothetical protein J6583_13720, partial [Gilliamella sp.]|nr:hypothetical protein [Gilliamella sp.]